LTYSTATSSSATPAIDEDLIWRLLQALAVQASRGRPVLDGFGIGLDERGALRVVPEERALIALRADCEHGWEARVPLSAAVSELLDLYLPLCVGPNSSTLVLAHLGQSLDGRVATVTGASRFVTGPEDLRHMHRLRALFDVVLVGAETARADDPQLTTRLVPGRQPVRVVLDPRASLAPSLRLLSDGCAPTIVVRARGTSPSSRLADHVDALEVTCDGGAFRLPELLEALALRGLPRVFIEGGGVTVSRFLEAGLLDRLQIAIAPKIIGSGTPALCLKPIEHMADAITTRCRRFVLGADMLFDCDLRSELA
jgi:diaminohydroxyphosphoribosylaminopyrimidine deaminase/5-amino-6-(5-phosphoribosylamino)uracil reductase